MTAALLETTAAGGTVPFTPTFVGRAQVGFGNGCASKGTVLAAQYGSQQVGFVDETLSPQYASAIGMVFQSPFFEASNSGGLNDAFNLAGPGHNSIATDRLQTTDYGCGDVEFLSVGTHGTSIVGALVLSGKTLDSKVGVIDPQGASGHVSVTGLGFAPQLVLFSWWGWSHYGVDSVGQTGQWSFGAYDGSSQWSAGCRSATYLSRSGRLSRFTTSAISTAPGYSDVQAVSLDGDGFTVNYVGPRGYVVWQAFADPSGQFSVGTGVEGDASIPVGFAADAVMLGTAGVDTFDADTAGCSLGLGSSDSSLAQLGGWGCGSGGSVAANRRYMDDCVFATSKIGAGVPIIPINSAQAEATAFNATTVDLNWSVGGSGGVKFGWIGWKCSSAAGFEGCGGFPQQIYRWLKK